MPTTVAELPPHTVVIEAVGVVLAGIFKAVGATGMANHELWAAINRLSAMVEDSRLQSRSAMTFGARNDAGDDLDSIDGVQKIMTKWNTAITKFVNKMRGNTNTTYGAVFGELHLA